MILRPWLAAALLSSAVLACGGGTLEPVPPQNAPGAAQSISISVDPAVAELQAGGTASFTANVYGTTDTSVAWSVVEPGGGRVDDQGRYTASGAPGSYHVVATSLVDATITATAVVTVQPSPTVVSSTAGGGVGGAADGRVGWVTGYWDWYEYMPSYSDIDSAAYTHVIDFSVDPAQLAAPANAAAAIPYLHGKGVKVILGTGSAAWCGYPPVVGNLSSWVSNAAAILDTYGFDGIDIYWEFGFCGNQPSTAQFCDFISALRDAIGGSKLLTIFSSVDYANYYGATCSDGQPLHAHVDQFNLDTYKIAYDDTGRYGLSSQVSGMTGAGVPKSKIGLAFGMTPDTDAGEVDTTEGECSAKAQWAADNGVSIATWGMWSPYAAACHSGIRPFTPSH